MCCDNCECEAEEVPTLPARCETCNRSSFDCRCNERCSFCQGNENLILGPRGVAICQGCVALAVEVLKERAAR